MKNSTNKSITTEMLAALTIISLVFSIVSLGVVAATASGFDLNLLKETTIKREDSEKSKIDVTGTLRITNKTIDQELYDSIMSKGQQGGEKINPELADNIYSIKIPESAIKTEGSLNEASLDSIELVQDPCHPEYPAILLVNVAQNDPGENLYSENNKWASPVDMELKDKDGTIYPVSSSVDYWMTATKNQELINLMDSNTFEVNKEIISREYVIGNYRNELDLKITFNSERKGLVGLDKKTEQMSVNIDLSIVENNLIANIE